MTRQEVIIKLKDYCADQEKKNGWWIIKKYILQFDRTYLLEQHNRTANLALPDSVVLSSVVTINNAGLLYKSVIYKWSTVVETIIKTQMIPTHNEVYENHYYLIFALISGDIYEIEIENFNIYFGQLGHFIEQFKLNETANL